VIDPHLVGKRKIRVIATGFERAGAMRRKGPAAGLATPTDLTNYTTHIARAEAAAPVEPVVPHSGAPAEAMAAAFTVTRRQPLELSLPLASNGNGAPADTDLDLSSPLDVPAFLRRPN
jgi:hypothetical protein